jgi:hypothetical protein
VHHKRKIALFLDHVTGRIDYEAANDLDNLETLCHRVHKAKDGHDNAEKRGFRRLK